jgi:predicted TIM-barrel fold metal-dependent hydrolase
LAEIPFIDTHVHFYDLRRTDLVYSWLQPDAVHPLIGDINAIKTLVYGAEAFLAESRFADVAGVVHVQAALGAADPVAETEWLEQMAQRTGCPAGIVAHADLADPMVGGILERHVSASARVRGVRDFAQGDYLVDPSWHRGYALLEGYGMICDLDCTWEQMGQARDLALQFPATPLVLEHAGFPRSRSAEYFENWRTGLAAMAEAENTWCKISGLGMFDQKWTVGSLRPWVLACIDAFGPARCFFGTNWPVDRLYSSYDPVVDAYAEIISGFSLAEREAMFFGNATSLYRLG